MEKKIGMPEEHFDKLLRGEKITEHIETTRGVFEIEFIDDQLQMAIIRRKAQLLDGGSIESIMPMEKALLEQTAVLDIAVKQGPQGWILGESSKYPDLQVKSDVYRRLLQLHNNVRGVPLSGSDVDSSDEPPVRESDQIQESPDAAHNGQTLHGSYARGNSPNGSVPDNFSRSTDNQY